MPMQLGPTRSSPASRAICVICSCAAMPSSVSVSAKPGGDGADDIIDLVRNLEQASVIGHAHRLDAGDLVRVHLHGVDFAHERLHAVEPEIPHPPLVADDGDGARGEGAVEALNEI